jgi:hypothetical protein
MTVQVLTRETAIPELTTPTGRKFGIRPFDQNPSLLEIHYADGKPGELPEKFKHHRFTKKELAVNYIKKYLEEFWDISDKSKK